MGLDEDTKGMHCTVRLTCGVAMAINLISDIFLKACLDVRLSSSE